MLMGADAMSLPMLIARDAAYMESIGTHWASMQCCINGMTKMKQSVAIMVVREVEEVGRNSSTNDAMVGQTGRCSTASASGSLHKEHG